MSGESSTKFCCDYAKRGTAGCKKCKAKCEKGALRIAKVVPNFFHDGEGEMKQWHHPKCIFETFEKARATTKIIDSTDEIEGFADLNDDDKELIKSLINDIAEKRANKGAKGAKTAAKSPAKAKSPAAANTKAAVSSKTPPGSAKTNSPAKSSTSTPTTTPLDKSSSPVKISEVKVDKNVTEDNMFANWIKLCQKISNHPSYNDKTNIVSRWLDKGSRSTTFNGDTFLTIKLLLPGFVKRVYNINSKQLVKLFSQIFGTSLTDMSDHLDQGDVAETIKVFFEKSVKVTPCSSSSMSLQEVDQYLEQMSKVTREEDQQNVLTNVTKRCTAEDLRMFIRLIKHDLRINAGAKHILEGLDSKAYEAFQASRDLRDVVDRVLAHKTGEGDKLTVRAQLMTPVLPMLAEACKSVGYAMKKCPDGMYAEIKYDGERVQLHKKGDDFQYFSRSLKPVLPHKVSHFKDDIPKAFPGGDNLILDAEVLLVDTKTSKPLPFGTLGIHKKAAFQDAQVCLFVFDCLYYNDENLMNKPIKERRKFLHKVMQEIPNKVMYSEQHSIKTPDKLNDLLEKVFREGLEGLVLKNVNSLYEPGKRHWLKVKKDYLADGAMADTADLVVLGAYYGTGNKGGIMSVFLMGCYNPTTKKWCTVTKVHGGHDDATLKRLQTELKMTKISKDSTKIPSWLSINKGTATPDFVATDPKDSQVWEITGAEFSKSDIHTADGISIRFPRVTRIRDDKDWKTATDLPRLKLLFEKSKETSTFSLGGKKPSLTEKSPSNSSKKSLLSPEDSKAKVKDSASPSKKRPAESNGGSTESPQKKVKKETNGSAKVKSEIKTEQVESMDTSSGQLADIFVGKSIYIDPEHPDYSKLKRYVIAYGAEFEQDDDMADIVISEKSEESDTKAATAKWLYDCIKAGKMINKH